MVSKEDQQMIFQWFRLSEEEVDYHRLPRFCSLQNHADPVIHNPQTSTHTKTKQLDYNNVQ